MTNPDGGAANWSELIGMEPAELIAMARKRAADLDLEASPNGHRNVINMRRHDYSPRWLSLALRC